MNENQLNELRCVADLLETIIDKFEASCTGTFQERLELQRAALRLRCIIAHGPTARPAPPVPSY